MPNARVEVREHTGWSGLAGYGCARVIWRVCRPGVYRRRKPAARRLHRPGATGDAESQAGWRAQVEPDNERRSLLYAAFCRGGGRVLLPLAIREPAAAGPSVVDCADAAARRVRRRQLAWVLPAGCRAGRDAATNSPSRSIDFWWRWRAAGAGVEARICRAMLVRIARRRQWLYPRATTDGILRCWRVVLTIGSVVDVPRAS